MDLRLLQGEHKVWSDKNFPDESATQMLLGAVEEIGELAHAELKGQQNIRHTPEEIRAMKEDAVGDVVIYLAAYCNQTGIDLAEAVWTTWRRVAARDWVNHPDTGGEE